MPSFATGKELAGLRGVLNRFVAAPAAGAALFTQGRPGSTLERALQSIPSTKNTDAGRSAWNELSYMSGQLMQGRLPYTAPPQQAQQTGMYGRYGRPSTQSYTPGVSTGSSSSPAAERAYQQEVSRVAQLTAQDPDVQRYEAARQLAAAKGATPEQVQSAEDAGMRIWAERNKTLAGKVKPGQAGYDVIQGVLNAGAMGAPADLPFAPDSLLGTNALQSIPSYAGASDLQPVGLPLPRTEFNTPQNQLQAQMFNRFLSEPSQPPVVAPPVNPAEATYEGATNLSPIDGISLDPFSFNTPAEKNRSDLFQRLLNSSWSSR
jgi:hypothetical protein